MTYTTTPPSEPGWYWIKPKDAEAHPCKFKEGYFVSQQWTAKPNLLLAYDYTFGPRIEPPRDDDEEAATVEWLLVNNVPHNDPFTNQKGLFFYVYSNNDVLLLHGDGGDDSRSVVATNPTRRKVRQIVEALR